MAILQVIELISGAGKTDARGHRTATRRFQVTSDNPLVYQEAVKVATDPNTGLRIPAMWTSFITETLTDLLMIVIDVSADRDENDWRVWNVTVNYSTDVKELLKGNPITHPAIIESWGSEKLLVALQKDVNGVAIVNPAGDPYEPPPTFELIVRVIRISKAFEFYPESIIEEVDGTTNSVEWYGYAPGQCRLVVTGATYVNEANVNGLITDFCKVNCEVKVMPPGADDEETLTSWHYKPLAQGLNAVDPSNLVSPLYHVIRNGKPVSQPVLLAEDGTELPFGGTPVFDDFTLHYESDFNLLIPDSGLPERS